MLLTPDSPLLSAQGQSWGTSAAPNILTGLGPEHNERATQHVSEYWNLCIMFSHPVKYVLCSHLDK